MKKAILILILVGILLAGCGKVKDGSSETNKREQSTETKEAVRTMKRKKKHHGMVY